MRKALIASATLLTMAVAYVAYPFLTAWSIREAIRSGNADYLDAKIEWPTVRETLRSSLVGAATGTSTGAVESASAEETATPGLWQRIKLGFAKRAIDNLVESYVTPEGLPQLFEYRKMYREHISGDPNVGVPWHERIHGFWSRIKRAEFKTLASFEIEMADRSDPSRHFVGLLELRGVEWKLTELRVKIAPPAFPVTSMG